MALAALRPAPIASITVAAPVTASPPAKTPSRLVRPSSSATMQPRRLVSKPLVVDFISGLGLVPRAEVDQATIAKYIENQGKEENEDNFTIVP